LVTPSAQLKTPDCCEPGELVFVDYGSGNSLALTARMLDAPEPWLVYLRPPLQCSPATFGVSVPFDKAVSLGNSYRLHVDVAAPFEIRPRHLYETSGAMCLVGAQWRLNV